MDWNYHKKCLTYGSICLVHSLIFAQTNDIVRNGGFEIGKGHGGPTISAQLATTEPNQLVEKCAFWGAMHNLSTPDWYVNATYDPSYGFLKGGCPIESGTQTEIVYAEPKLHTHDGSGFYAGFGSTEHIVNELWRDTYQNSKVKVSFWFALRGKEYNFRETEKIIVKLFKAGQSSGMNLEVALITVFDKGTPLYPACKWNYYESEWISTDPGEEYNRLLIGGASPPNKAGRFHEEGYIYIDDVKLYNGRDCCPEYWLFENTNNMPTKTHVWNYIRAGYDAGIPNMAGDVIIQPGHDITLKAGSEITLLPGFHAQAGWGQTSMQK